MSDLIRSQVESNDAKITKYQIQDNVNNDKLIRHQVMGIGGGSAPVIENLSVTENGTYTVTAGVDGYNPVVVDVPTVIESLSVTENGTYTVTAGVDGYNPVVVDVPPVLPANQLISDIRIDTTNNKIYDFVRSCDVSNANVVLNNDVMEVAVNGYIQTLIGLSDDISYKIEVDIDSIPQPTADARGLTLLNFSPRGGDNVYLGYDNRSGYDTKTYYMYGSSGYNYPDNTIGNINYNYFDNSTMDIYYNAVYNTALNKWTKNQVGENSNKFRLYAHNSTIELIANGRSGAVDEIQNFKIGRPSNTLIANIKAIRVYLLNGLEVIS